MAYRGTEAVEFTTQVRPYQAHSPTAEVQSIRGAPSEGNIDGSTCEQQHEGAAESCGADLQATNLCLGSVALAL